MANHYIFLLSSNQVKQRLLKIMELQALNYYFLTSEFDIQIK